ncbi:16S rRNA (cytosine(1402)-N(4))-methyltransferase [Candidatus Curtissbacteria bacterium RIFCSPHIGHO2_01_FULL_41_44]|uniref:Ribosomal RNA small subunit methyltransferase H n=1 Tax=Candidatus Curtissbacteria bacterium RIFCSPLOWO2_01_FULL_42_50 TaxID=1797730 RepID=A0A1F5H365_9BACT|nr:MAG: 16S rRNA (cytosine(1402)-N(4))-methyltransferase [Candidatus Curtissbacteria bacterium RIFCSPHIGHO2_02_FULL_42_58]OGD94540.1 MAG: 16S rRNA (cytosine(1402)-N(4))-methyltransferase [Candidatus Curtissbacteria bacterium RIFCSPHIGHO2_01_FULL_41_44]OGD97925.1 MAG: 16S rRNA (cytosine(1402)-N(4))-methyltransferase [Candidatus Curtissbacteria bacterium RIFCSPHIGHO2_12_FULL_42_33]OGD98573.1 MAG: 16S rRNA (cytosine(1402)-N(4))-methyltransferase [Candidatus Curtissbacteria bacterium RIFCSPLOWO2_01_
MKYHTPVLLQEVIDFLNPAPGDLFIDATVGGAGHTHEILKRGARVLGIDRDPEAIEHIKNQFKIRENLHLVRGNFTSIGQIARENGFNQINGIIFDLGVSSHQLEKAQRGFSFEKEGPLDMRMDPALTIKAYDIVNNFDQRRLNEIFKTYGQEKYSWPISEAICSARQIKPVETTTELAQIVKKVIPRGVRGRYVHPATKTFLALRIVVNSELLNLQASLPQTVEILKIGGRLAVISFHSLEDGLVKRFFKQEAKLQVLTKKPIGPANQEILENPKSRSAKLRVAERI